ncbi:uroporphyrinogen decarboxylase [Calderihabitans maritimus]|uniref:Uroporphyrinogen decarboxylase n=1 Tax=Calderihabitans maritimus TaxID=1246530 RepID=A0A1Z5HN28_9FIRM|nr:uroporphyrinogen decarboxylase [Calderihabitans maritimus]GAW90919.1 uroporphyrinogen decarboxylase [Calderihabitans maritimus]
MNDRFLKACRREEVDCTPVWLMRQAGRYMKEYMEIRSKYSFLTMCKTPELAAEVTLQPVDKLGVDAAILFADILLPLEGMGIELEFAQNEGPAIHNPVRSEADVEKLRLIEPEEDVPYVLEAVRLVRRELAGKVPLIGFSGAPFTLASYIIEGGGSKSYLHCKEMMWKAPRVWHALMEKIAEVVVRYLRAQIRAGAQAVQVFDSWVGTLSPEDYEEFVLPHSRYVMENLKKEGVPVIHFANNASTLLELVKMAGGDVIGVDWRINLDEAWRRIGYDVAIQGNLDPAALLAPPEVIEKKVRRILERAGGRPGHIFNLGHGIHKETPVEHAIALVEAVHKYSKRS